MATVSLTKGGRVSLTKENGKVYDTVRFGANWGAIQRGSRTRQVTKQEGGFFSKLLGAVKEVFEDTLESPSYESVDLDLSAIILNNRNEVINTVYFGRREAFGGDIYHSGDDLTGDQGADDGRDNETITVKLNRLPAFAQRVFFVLNSFRHHKFDEIPHMGCRIYAGRETLASFNIANDSGFQGKEAMVIGQFYRYADTWKFKAEGLMNNDKSIGQLEQTVKALV